MTLISHFYKAIAFTGLLLLPHAPAQADLLDKIKVDGVLLVGVTCPAPFLCTSDCGFTKHVSGTGGRMSRA